MSEQFPVFVIPGAVNATVILLPPYSNAEALHNTYLKEMGPPEGLTVRFGHIASGNYGCGAYDVNLDKRFDTPEEKQKVVDLILKKMDKDADGAIKIWNPAEVPVTMTQGEFDDKISAAISEAIASQRAALEKMVEDRMAAAAAPAPGKTKGARKNKKDPAADAAENPPEEPAGDEPPAPEQPEAGAENNNQESGE